MSKEKGRLSDRLNRLYRFLVTDIFRMTENELTKSKRISVRILKKLVLSIRGFFEDDLMYRASVLTYYTLLAIVPIFALILAVGRGFGIQDAINDLIVRMVGESHDILPFFMRFVNNYLEQAHGGVFVGIGVIILLWSVVSMFRQVENNFNRIWNVHKNRSIVRQFTTYLTILVVTPILVVVSASLSSAVDSYVEYVANSSIGSFFVPIYQFFIRLTPYVAYWLLFTIVFLVIPNTKVRFRDALFSAIVTGTAFYVLQIIYVSGQVTLSKYNAVYGSFAAIPLLMFWLQISWLIVLYGAELCYVSQNLSSYNFESDTKNISRRYKDFTLVIVLKIVIRHFEDGKPVSSNDISTEYNIPIRLVQNHLELLVDTGIVSEVYAEQQEEKMYQPAMDINRITLGLLTDRIERFGSENFRISHADEFETVWKSMSGIRNLSMEQAKDILIKDM